MQVNDGEDNRDPGEGPHGGQGTNEVHSHGPEAHTNAMDVIDTRIEGVEDIMLELKRTVHKLSRKVRVGFDIPLHIF